MALEDSLVAIVTNDGNPVGAGLLIKADLVLTCAHVVNAAIHRSRSATGRPQAKISVRRHGAAETITAEILSEEDGWSDPPGSRGKGADLCILSLPSAQSNFHSVGLQGYANPSMKPFRTAGFPEKWGGDLDIAIGQILGLDFDPGGLWMLSPHPRGDPSKNFLAGDQRRAGVIHAGFSGGPVEGKGGSIIGLITEARNPSEMTAYMISAQHFPKRFPKRRAYKNEVEEDFQYVENLTSSLSRTFLSERIPFDLRLRFCSDFAEVLEAHRRRPISNSKTARQVPDYDENRDLKAYRVAEMLRNGTDDQGASLGSVLLHAPGGAGKSSFLAELLLSSAEAGLVPFRIDFSKGDVGGSSRAVNAKDRLRDWFSLKESWGDFEKLLSLAGGPSEKYKALLVIDGANQSSMRWSEVLATIQTLSRGALAGAAVIIADRMTDRGVAMKDFTHAVIPPLAPAAYQWALRSYSLEKLGKDRSWWTILASPLFLNLFLRTVSTSSAGSKAIPSRFQVLNRYFRETCSLGSSEIKLLSDFAYEMYERYRQTAIPKKDLGEFYAKAGKELRKKIEIQEVVVVRQPGNDPAEFRHQLLHDWLAALKLASALEREDEALLRAPGFSNVSLDAASYDPIELGLEALQYPGDLLQKREKPLEAREMLAAVFDWSYWIAFQCVASFDRRGESPLPAWVRHAIYAHNLEKQFDSFFHTALFAEQLRSQIPPSQEVSYAEATSRTEIERRIEAIMKGLDDSATEKEYCCRWLDIYLRSCAFTRADLQSLWDDPFLSWTAANVIRRFKISRAITEELILMYQVSKKTSDSAPKAAMFRWRIVHALGKADTIASKALLAIAFDPLENLDVRYGAIRSLIELAATGGKVTDVSRILEEIHSRLPELFLPGAVSQLRRVRRELRRMCALNEPHVTGRETWLEDWLTVGLPSYIKILQCGEGLAVDSVLSEEAELWRAWRLAAQSALTAANWETRKQIWQGALEKDQ